MNVLAIIAFGFGTILAYGGIRNVNPIEFVKAVVSGETPPSPGSWGTPLGESGSPGGMLRGGTFEFSGYTGKAVWPAQSRHVTNGWHVPNSRYQIGYHTGIDISRENGLKVVSPVDGKIIGASWQGSYGNTVRIRTTDGKYEIWLAHLAAFVPGLIPGRKISAGTRVGTMGDSGTNSSGVHLHFEVRTAPFRYGNDVNPNVLFGGN